MHFEKIDDLLFLHKKRMDFSILFGLVNQMYGIEDDGECVCHGGHHLDEDIQGNTDDVFSCITNGITGDGCLVGRGAFAASFDAAGFNELFRIVEGTAGVAHEQGFWNGSDRGADQQAADKFSTGKEAADDRDDDGENSRHHHFL